MSRRLARETALQVLFQKDMSGDLLEIEHTVRGWGEEFAVPETSLPFAQELVKGTLEHLAEIDTQLAQLAEGWSLTRMANVDRNLLRMACYEIIYLQEIPGRVTINEALEIAKRYGTDESGPFINGILDRLVKNVDKKDEKK